ncbi:MAG: DUF4349 domain-containing protein [Pyrinomonadaceae bacterium]
MRQLPKIILFSLITLTFTACANTFEKSTAPQESMATVSQKSAADNGSGAPQAEKISLEQADNSQNAPTITERKIIRNANLTLESATTEEVGRKIAQIAEQRGGFVVSSDMQARTNSSGEANGSTVNLVVRVPAAQFEQTVAEIRQTSNRVVQEKVSGQDVTEEFIDLEARLKTKRALEAQFLEIMKQSRTVSDALEVQKQLAEVRGEIEKIEGKRKFLESQTSLSTITITLNPPAAFAASSNGFFYQVGRAFSNGIDAALNVVLFLITAILALFPLIVLFGVPIWLIFRYLRKRIQRAQLAQQLAKED